MSLSRRTLFAAAGVISLGGAAFAEAPVQIRVRGVINRLDAHALHVVTSAGKHETLKLPANLGVTFIEPISINAIKPGSFIGTAAITQPDGTLKAMEVQVFPEAMRGVGEGHRAWDRGAGSTMTNGTVGDLKVSHGRTLTLNYKGGEQTVFVPEKAPVITYKKATRQDLKKGAHVIAFVTENADGTMTATRIGVGMNGLVPPM